MTKHTPGPWNFQPCEDYSRCFEVMCEFGYYVATTHDGVRGYENAEANARLVAAAPDLLEALRSAVNDADAWGLADDECDWLPIARTAIARATGEQP